MHEALCTFVLVFKRPEHVHAVQTLYKLKVSTEKCRTTNLEPAPCCEFIQQFISYLLSPSPCYRSLRPQRRGNHTRTRRTTESCIPGRGGQLWLAGRHKEAFQPLIGRAQQKQGVQGKQRASVQGRQAVRPMAASGTGSPSPVFAGFKTSGLVNLPVLPSGGWYNELAITDMNGDGKTGHRHNSLDRLVSGRPNTRHSSSRVFLNDGKGGYTAAAPTALGTGQTTGINWCAAVDLGGNGRSSLVCPQQSTTTGAFSLVLYPSNGDGTFATPRHNTARGTNRLPESPGG